MIKNVEPYPNNSIIKKKINDAIGNFIAVGNYPFSIVEN